MFYQHHSNVTELKLNKTHKSKVIPTTKRININQLIKSPT